MIRQRVSAVIIKDKKILMVRDSSTNFFCIPGGGIEDGELKEGALKRELREELGVEIVTIKFLTSYQYINQITGQAGEEFIYQVTIIGNPMVSGEIEELGYFPGTKLEKNIIEIPNAFRLNVLPLLLKENYL